MTCKDCLCFSRCKEMYESFGVFIDLENSAVCKHFKNKADFVDVKHGHWIKRGNEKKCSVCGFIYYSNNDEWNGCPNCLAKMDGRSGI